MQEQSCRLLQRGIDLFDRQEFFEAHEVWEDAWRAEGGDTRLFFQGLIQVAAGFVKLQRRQPRGASALLERGSKKLAGIPPDRYGLDLAPLLEAVSAWRENAARMAGSGLTDIEPFDLPRLKPAAQSPQ